MRNVTKWRENGYFFLSINRAAADPWSPAALPLTLSVKRKFQLSEALPSP